MSRKLCYTVEESCDGAKVYDYLHRIQGYSARLINTLKHLPDGMLLEGRHARTIDRVLAGQRLTVTLPDEEDPGLHLSALVVPIVYEDEDVLVYNKPAGMNCHPSRRVQQDTLANVFAAHCADEGQARTFRCLTRLDKNTSGLVLLAKNQRAADLLKNRCEKEYFALVHGIPKRTSGVIDAPIARVNEVYTRRQVSPEGQRAVTHYEVLSAGEGYSLVKLLLETGRTHQIRVHMAHLGHPLAGDDMYGGSRELIARQALHCGAMCFVSPITGRPVQLEVPLPEDVQKALDAARIYM